MSLSREQREELRRRIDEEKRRRIDRAGSGRPNLAMACYEQARGDPVLALWLAIRFVQRYPELFEAPASEEEDREQRNRAIRAMRREGHTLREIGERFGLSPSAIYQITASWNDP